MRMFLISCLGGGVFKVETMSIVWLCWLVMNLLLWGWWQQDALYFYRRRPSRFGMKRQAHILGVPEAEVWESLSLVVPGAKPSLLVLLQQQSMWLALMAAVVVIIVLVVGGVVNCINRRRWSCFCPEGFTCLCLQWLLWCMSLYSCFDWRCLFFCAPGGAIDRRLSPHFVLVLMHDIACCFLSS